MCALTRQAGSTSNKQRLKKNTKKREQKKENKKLRVRQIGFVKNETPIKKLL